MYQIRRLLGTVLLIFLSLSVQSFQSYQVVGEGQLRWFVFNVYQARLLSPDGGGYHQNKSQQDKWPLALELTYQRTIKKSELIATTESEWQRMQVGYVQEWLEALNGFWPNVKKDDVLLLHVDIKGHSYFYYNDELIGDIEDKNFSRAFLAIWLSEKSRDQSLRKQLLGTDNMPIQQTRS